MQDDWLLDTGNELVADHVEVISPNGSDGPK